ncbi:VPS9 domain-containing protein, partial [Shewanella sp. A3A]|nr:VPS9 domain-containing protein [Shewanella ferrihydritica]
EKLHTWNGTINSRYAILDSDDELNSDALVSLLVLTLIRGQVAHLVANITYMKVHIKNDK